MRIVVAGDRFWNCPALAEALLRRPIARCGSDVVVANGGASGVDQSFSMACRDLGVKRAFCLADFSHLGNRRFRNRETFRVGAGLCLIVHGAVLDEGSADLARQAIAVELPTYLIDSEDGHPRRLRANDRRVE